LNDPDRLENQALQFHGVVIKNYEESVQVKQLVKVLNELDAGIKRAPQWIPYQYVYGTLRARMLNFSRPFHVWLGDFSSFLFAAKCYSLRQRLFASIHVSVDLMISLIKRVLGGAR
jgi:hypothetical protein